MWMRKRRLRGRGCIYCAPCNISAPGAVRNKCAPYGSGLVLDDGLEPNAVSAKGPPHGIKGFSPPCIARPSHRAGDLAATCASFCWSNNLAAINCPEPTSDRHPAVWQCTAFVSADKEWQQSPAQPTFIPPNPPKHPPPASSANAACQRKSSSPTASHPRAGTHPPPANHPARPIPQHP